MTEDPRSLTSVDARLRAAAHRAVMEALKKHALTPREVSLPEGEEIEVLSTPRFPVEGARFFLRVEVASVAEDAERRTVPPRVAVPAALLRSWRIVPEPVAVVSIDPETGAGRMGEVHPFLAYLDRNHRGWDRHPSVMFPLSLPLDGERILRLARAAADGHVLFRRVVDHAREFAAGEPPADPVACGRLLRESDFALTAACLDLLREAGLVVEAADRSLVPSEPCASAFARAAVQHRVGARGHADPATEAEAGMAAVARVLLSRIPSATESTLERCAVVLARLLPVADADAILEITTDPDALGRALEE